MEVYHFHFTALTGKIHQVCKRSTPETRKIQIHQHGGWEWKQREHYFHQQQKAHPGLFVLGLSLVDVNNLNSGLMFKCSIWFLLLYLVFVLVLSFWYINLVAASRQSLRFQALCLLGHCLSEKNQVWQKFLSSSIIYYLTSIRATHLLTSLLGKNISEFAKLKCLRSWCLYLHLCRLSIVGPILCVLPLVQIRCNFLFFL